MKGDSNSTYIHNLLWGAILMQCGGATSTYTEYSKILRWDILGRWPKIDYNGENLW